MEHTKSITTYKNRRDIKINYYAVESFLVYLATAKNENNRFQHKIVYIFSIYIYSTAQWKQT